MKINDTEMKARFFALYWGQIVALVTKGSYTHPLGTLHVVNSHIISNTSSIAKHRYSLNLKPLSLISDEDVLEVVKILEIESEDLEHPNWKVWIIEIVSDRSATTANSMGRFLSIIDLLRSKSYALPFMQYSVEQLVEKNWIKLTES